MRLSPQLLDRKRFVFTASPWPGWPDHAAVLTRARMCGRRAGGQRSGRNEQLPRVGDLASRPVVAVGPQSTKATAPARRRDRDKASHLVLRLDDGTAYIVDWVNLTRLTSAGIIGAAKEAMAPGARVAVTGYLIRNAAELRRIAPKFKGDVNPNTVEARSLRRVDDSFSWPPSPSPYTPNCERK